MRREGESERSERIELHSLSHKHLQLHRGLNNFTTTFYRFSLSTVINDLTGSKNALHSDGQTKNQRSSLLGLWNGLGGGYRNKKKGNILYLVEGRVR